MVGANDKWQIIAVFCGTVMGDFLLVQVIYKGKTQVVKKLEAKWLVDMVDYISNNSLMIVNEFWNHRCSRRARHWTTSLTMRLKTMKTLILTLRMLFPKHSFHVYMVATHAPLQLINGYLHMLKNFVGNHRPQNYCNLYIAIFI